jgi:predicted nucleic acid-binding protein
VILLDTNLLARMTNAADPQCAAARLAVQKLSSGNEQLVIVPQNLYEFWAVATRARGAPPSGQNGLGMTCNQASMWLAFFQRRFTLLLDRNDLLQRWHDLVNRLSIAGFRSHDARLVAAMESYGIARLMTFNALDFKRFAITVVEPASI